MHQEDGAGKQTEFTIVMFYVCFRFIIPNGNTWQFLGRSCRIIGNKRVPNNVHEDYDQRHNYG